MPSLYSYNQGPHNMDTLYATDEYYVDSNDVRHQQQLQMHLQRQWRHQSQLLPSTLENPTYDMAGSLMNSSFVLSSSPAIVGTSTFAAAPPASFIHPYETTQDLSGLSSNNNKSSGPTGVTEYDLYYADERFLASLAQQSRHDSIASAVSSIDSPLTSHPSPYTSITATGSFPPVSVPRDSSGYIERPGLASLDNSTTAPRTLLGTIESTTTSGFPDTFDGYFGYPSQTAFQAHNKPILELGSVYLSEDIAASPGASTDDSIERSNSMSSVASSSIATRGFEYTSVAVDGLKLPALKSFSSLEVSTPTVTPTSTPTMSSRPINNTDSSIANTNPHANIINTPRTTSKVTATAIDSDTDPAMPVLSTSPARKRETDVLASKNQHKRKVSSSATGPVPASSSMIVRKDEQGVDWIWFVYSKDKVKGQYSIRCDIETVDPESFGKEFRKENCVYPRAAVPASEYTGKRQKYETECNYIGWCLAYLNESIRGQRGLIQRAVDSWRNTHANPEYRSRRVRRMSKLNDRKNELKGVTGDASMLDDASSRARSKSFSDGTSTSACTSSPESKKQRATQKRPNAGHGRRRSMKMGL